MVDNEVHTFFKGITSKVNGITLLELELASNEAPVYQVSHYVTGSAPRWDYWPSTVPSIKRWTCVNKRKNSGSRLTLENILTRCPGCSSQLESECRSENQLQTDGFGPFVIPSWATQTKMRKKYCYGRWRTWVNIAVRSCLHSFLTDNKHFLFKIKCERFIFLHRSVFVRNWSRHYQLIMFACIFVYA